jgi:hypothetical protein
MSFETLQVYIARVEYFHPKNFVSATLRPLGNVETIDYIPKKDFNGNDYYSAIVKFKRWIMSEDTIKLLNDLAVESQVKYYYEDRRGQSKYWVIKEYIKELQPQQSQQPYETPQEINNSYDCQMEYYRVRNLTLERQLVEMNSTEITQRFQINHLNEKLDEIDITKQTLLIRDMDLTYIQEENKKLKEELELLKRDIKDRDRIIDHYEELTYIG